MWPFRKKSSKDAAKASDNDLSKTLRMVDPARSEYQTHREFVGQIGIGVNGFLSLNELSLNKSFRHCRIGKIVLKRA